MERSDGILKQLFARRVPQIIGLYIAATWMTVEIGEWVTEQLNLSGSLVFYVFVLMAALLPAVAVLAWNHGAPGRDQSPRGEKWFVSANAAVALLLLLVVAEFSPMGNVSDVQAATIEKVVIDEAGEEQVFQVAREGFHKRVALSFWTSANADSQQQSAWEGYATPWLISVGLNFDPLLSANTPYLSGTIDKLKEAGFDNGTGEPLALALQIARNNRADFLIRGVYESGDSGYRLTARVYNAQSGRQINEHLAEGVDLIQAVAALNEQIKPSLVGNIERDADAFANVQLAEAATGNMLALQTLIDGLNAWLINNDYPVAINNLNQALDQDSEFALAHFWLHALHRLNGDLAAATQATEDALRFSYKLHSETSFILKANGYGMQGDVEKAIRVLDMWTQVHPESETAWITLAQNYLFLGDPEQAKTALSTAQEIDPDNATIYRLSARAEELSGNLELATRQMNDYLEQQPEDYTAWLSLANMHLRSGQIEQAREAYESASITGSDTFAAELGIIRTEAFGGSIERALRMLNEEIEQHQPGTDLSQLIFDKSLLLAHAGRPQAALDLLDQYEPQLRQSLAPILYVSNLADLKVNLLLSLGQTDQAMMVFEQLQAELAPPTDQLMLNTLLLVLEVTGDTAEVEQIYNQLAEFYENFDFAGSAPFTLQAEAIFLATQGNFGEASERIATALERVRNSSLNSHITFIDQLQLALTRYQLADGQPEAAKATIENLLRTNRNHGYGQWLQILVEQALVEKNQSNNGRVQELLDRLLEQWQDAEPDYPPYQQALALQETLNG
ncbi:MAG: tetratricopeptide repeat protein [Pseudomonadota bacterium]